MSETTTELVFEDPPPSGGGRQAGKSELGRWLAALREHPGRWAKYPKMRVTQHAAAAVAGTIKRGKGYGLQAGEFETTTRKAEDGKGGWLFARYVGADS